MSTSITRDVYPMPSFVTIEVTNVAATVSWYVDGLGFISLFSLPGPAGVPSLVHLRRERYQDILVVPASGPVTPPSGLRFSVQAEATDLPDLVDRARAHGGGRIDGPTDTPWNTRDVIAVDPDGYTVVFTARRPEGERDEEFGRRITTLHAEQSTTGSTETARRAVG